MIHFRSNKRPQAQIISVDIFAKMCLLLIVKILQNAGFDFQVLRFEDGMLSFEVTLSKHREGSLH